LVELENRRFERTPPLFGGPVEDDLCWRVAEIFCASKPESQSYRMALFVWS